MLLDGKRAADFKDTPTPASSPKTEEVVETAPRKMMTPPRTPEKEKTVLPPPVSAKEVAPTTAPATVSTPPKSQLRALPPQQDSVRRQSRFSDRVLTVDEWELSLRVRSMYEFGNEKGIDHGLAVQTLVEEEDDATEMLPPMTSASKAQSLRMGRIRSNNHHDLRQSPSFYTKRESFIPRERYEFAGGIEDWEDVDGDEVDRYGFILPKHTSRLKRLKSISCYIRLPRYRYATRLHQPPRSLRFSTPQTDNSTLKLESEGFSTKSWYGSVTSSLQTLPPPSWQCEIFSQQHITI